MTEPILEGNVHLFGDDIDTDVIIAGRHLGNTDPRYLASHCFETLRPDFARSVKPGDILVAGHNFGCGSSREHAPIALKATGLSCVIVASAARIFSRSAINIGLPVLICPDAANAARDGDRMRADLATGIIEYGEKEFQADPVPQNILKIIEAGGLVAVMAERFAKKKR